MKSPRRGIAGIAAAALTATGLSVLGAATAPAHAAPVAVDDAQLRWGINNEANAAGFAPGTWNLMSAGKIGDPGAGGKTLKAADNGATWSNDAPAGWTSSAGNVTVEDRQPGGGYAPATFLGTHQDFMGVNGTTGNGVLAETQLVFRNGTGTIDTAANTASIQWDGDASVIYYSGMSFFYVSDPKLTVNGDGSGELTATVDGFGTDQAAPDEWVDLDADEVTLATLSDVDVETLGFTATPDYLGVEYDAPVGAVPQARTGTAWGSFPQSFVDWVQQTGGGPYWYSSGGAADARKPTTALSLTFGDEAPAAPKVTVSPTTLAADGSHQVTVTGSGFDPALATGTRPPLSGKAGGAYVVFAKFPTAWRPSANVPSANRKIAAQKWAVLAADMATIGGPNAGAIELTPEGTFSATLTVDKAAADTAAAAVPTATNYGIYTYPGSGAVAASYETYTPITFTTKPEPQKPTPSATVAPAKKPNAKGKKGSVTITSTGLAGQQVTVVVKQTKPKAKGKKAKKKATKTITVTIDASGTTTVALPKLAKGTHKVTVTYPGGTSVTKVKVKGKK
ncbi:hypothetical protein RB608_00540 [Nocardioides sp. LHD-245]|uniref:hypothetical protein n=1 Tax=Nocardioides sp. LHD-245 TaxID=3051387 RepID=UPI0027DEAD3E|nr:hypothetical protein [Nocardioides sp. LHD-245]